MGYLVGFDSQVEGGRWVWWLDSPCMQRLNKKYPKTMVRPASPEEVPLMDCLRNVCHPKSVAEKQAAEQLLKLLGW